MSAESYRLDTDHEMWRRAFRFVTENVDGTPLFGIPYSGLVLVLIGVGFLLWGFVGCAPPAPVMHHFDVRVDGTDGLLFGGTIGAGGQSRSVEGRIPSVFQCEGIDCVAVLQKKQSGGTLSVKIERDHEGVGIEATTAPYGLVTISGH